ncbi:MAG: hypothetical protein U0Q15_00405 [Kineosporiaceae bacterium]
MTVATRGPLRHRTGLTGQVSTLVLPVRDLAAGIAAIAAATAAAAGALLDPRVDPGVDLAQLGLFDNADDLAM